MAEREGFEPSVRLLTVHSLSRRAPSANSAISPVFSYQLKSKLLWVLLRDRILKFKSKAARCLLELAEGEGFEPPVPLITGQRFSRPPPSTTRPSLLAMISSTYNFNCQGSSTLFWGLWSAEIFQRVTSWNIPYVKGLLSKKAPVFQPIRYSAQTVRLDREFHEDCFKKRRVSASIL